MRLVGFPIEAGASNRQFHREATINRIPSFLKFLARHAPDLRTAGGVCVAQTWRLERPGAAKGQTKPELPPVLSGQSHNDSLSFN
jgi:hypothetical protein